MNSDVIKVAIYYESKNFYFSLQSGKSLRENINDICVAQNINGSDSWGLKRKIKSSERETKNVKKYSNLEQYYYIDDLSSVQNGDELMLVSSISVKLLFIFKNYTDISFVDLALENSDTLFLRELVDKKNHFLLMNYILEIDNQIENLKIGYQTILQILKQNIVSSLPEPFVLKLIQNVIDCKIEKVISDFNQTRQRPHILEYSLSSLCELMAKKDWDINYKQEITQIPIAHLISMCRLRAIEFQLKPLKLLNCIVQSVIGEGRLKLLKEMDTIEFRNTLWENVIQDLKKSQHEFVSREVYIYQCMILSRLYDKLTTPADPEVLKQYECVENSENRLSDILEFQEDILLDYKGKWNSDDMILGESYRYSVHSVSSRDSITTIKSFPRVEDNVCKLTEDCLVYYSEMYETHFNQSKLEEAVNQTKITVSADRIVKMLVAILRIGSRMDKKRTDFQPLVFNTSLKQGFFIELFCRTMWLLSKTRREMQAYVADDFDKVLNILEQQIRKTLQFKPLSLSEMLKHMKTLTYKTICETLEQESERNWKKNLDKNPCVQLLKAHFQTDNAALIKEQRLGVMKAGQEFPKLPEVKLKKQQYFTVELSPTCKELLYYDCSTNLRKAFTPKLYNISSIRHVVIGTNCPFYKDNTVKNPSCLFALQLEGDTYIHFLGKDEQTAQYWMDGFHILLGKTEFSESYKKELDELTKMDVAIQLLELQNVEIPAHPPPLPLAPPRPPIPPRPNIQKQVSQNHNNQN